MKKKKTGITSKISAIAILVVVLSGSTKAQQTLDSLKNYTFEFLGGCDSHVVNRQFLDDSTFVEKATITYSTGSYSIIDTFMTGSDMWFYRNKGEWCPYFSKIAFHEKRKSYFFGEEKMVNYKNILKMIQNH